VILNKRNTKKPLAAVESFVSLLVEEIDVGFAKLKLNIL